MTTTTDDPNVADGSHAAPADGGPWFWVAAVLGWAIIIIGVRMGLHDHEVKPGLLVRWLVGGLILHDGVWLPVVAVVGAGLLLLARRRVPPPIVWALATSVVLTLIAWPFLRGYGRRADVPSALQRNYAHGLLAYIAVTWVVALSALVIGARRRRGEQPTAVEAV